MPKWRVTITIVREFDNRANAITSCDALTAKVPAGWEIRTEQCEKV